MAYPHQINLEFLKEFSLIGHHILCFLAMGKGGAIRTNTHNNFLLFGEISVVDVDVDALQLSFFYFPPIYNTFIHIIIFGI